MGFTEHLSGVKYMNLNRMYFKGLRTRKKIKVMRKKRYIQKFSFDTIPFTISPSVSAWIGYQENLREEMKTILGIPAHLIGNERLPLNKTT